MQTRTYGDLFKLIQSLAGVSSFATTETDDIANLINRRYFEAYQTIQMWPRYLEPSEERNVSSYLLSGADPTSTINQYYRLLGQQDDSDSKNIYEGITTSSVRIFKNASNAWTVATSTTVSQNSDGTYDITSDGVSQFTEQDTVKKNLLEDVEVFDNRIGGGTDILDVQRKNLIPYAETGKNTIAEFIRIHRKKAFLNKSAIEYDFFVDSDGANILNVVNSDDGKAFVTYKIPLTLFTVAVSDPPVAADFVDGGTSNGAANRALTVPLEFFYYLAHSSFADFLRIESKYSDARAEEDIAQTYLAQELEKIDIRNNNNSLNKKFSTYVNRQSR